MHCPFQASLGETSVVYDIGAGTGSVAVEAARMAFRGHVYAVERNPEGLKLIRENQEALRAAGLQWFQEKRRRLWRVCRRRTRYLSEEAAEGFQRSLQQYFGRIRASGW